MGLGVGLINEIVELTAVVYLNAQEGVGDYLNNAIDLVYNSIGVIVTVVILDISWQYHHGELKKLESALISVKRGISKIF
jgi:flagellar biosynthesis protein FlhB